MYMKWSKYIIRKAKYINTEEYGKGTEVNSIFVKVNKAKNMGCKTGLLSIKVQAKSTQNSRYSNT